MFIKNKQISVRKYALVAFKDTLTTAVLAFSELKGPRRKVNGATVTVAEEGKSKKGTIVTISVDKDCLYKQQQILNTAKFFGIKPRKNKSVKHTGMLSKSNKIGTDSQKLQTAGTSLTMSTIEIGSVATKPIYVHKTCYTNDLPSPISDPDDPYFFPDSPNVSDSDDTDSNTSLRDDSEDTEYDLNKAVVQDWLDSTNLVHVTDETASSNITLISDPSSDPTTPLIPHKLSNAVSIPTAPTIVPPQAKAGDLNSVEDLSSMKVSSNITACKVENCVQNRNLFPIFTVKNSKSTAIVHPYEKDDIGSYDDVCLMEVDEAEEFQGFLCQERNTEISGVNTPGYLDDELQLLETIKGTANRSIATPLLYEEDMSIDSS